MTEGNGIIVEGEGGTIISGNKITKPKRRKKRRAKKITQAVLAKPLAQALNAQRTQEVEEGRSAPKPNLPPLDPQIALREAWSNALEGNAKLTRTIDALRLGLQTLSVAEYDRVARREVTADELRRMARETLSACGFGGRRQVIETRAGTADHDLSKNSGNDGEDYD